MKTNSTILKVIGRKLALSFLLAVYCFGAFATLGDGKTNKEKPRISLLSVRTAAKPGSFSLQSGYIFRGNQVMSVKETRYVNLNSTAFTYQQGHTAYTLPIQKKVTVRLTSQNQVQSATIKVKF